MSAIIWFDINYMKLNENKCHFLFAGNTPEFLWVKVGKQFIWESTHEKLLGLTIDKKLNFNKHLSILCKKVGGKVSAFVLLFFYYYLKLVTITLKSKIYNYYFRCTLYKL